MLTDDQSAALVTARQTIRRQLAGDDADLTAAAALLDRVLRASCPHGRSSWVTSEIDGESFTTCVLCGYGWFDQGE